LASFPVKLYDLALRRGQLWKDGKIAYCIGHNVLTAEKHYIRKTEKPTDEAIAEVTTLTD
jgi:hypothetical protein